MPADPLYWSDLVNLDEIECVPAWVGRPEELFPVAGTRLYVLGMFSWTMAADRPANWRMPTTKQLEKMAAERAIGRQPVRTPSCGPADQMPPQYWDAVLKAADANDRRTGQSIQSRMLSQIGRHVLRVGCSRCGRTVEIQTADAIRLYGPESVWNAVGQRLLDDTCTQRTGSHEDDGCWPSFD